MRAALFLLMALFSVTAFSAGAGQWHKVESPHFVFYSDQSPDAAREKIQEMELFRELALMVTGIQAVEGGPKLEVYLASELSQFEDLSNLDGKQYVSKYFAGWAGDRAAVVRDFGDEDFNQSALLSMYVVELMFGNSAVLYPAWYVSGLPEYLSQVKFSDTNIAFGMAAQDRLDQLRLQNMDPRFSWEQYSMLMKRKRRPESWVETYDAQSWLATHFFMSDEKRKKVLMAYLEAFNRHGDASKAYKDTIGERYTNFNQEMIRYFAKGRYVTGNIKLQKKVEYPTEVTALNAADVLMAKGRAYMLAGSADKCMAAFSERLTLLPDDVDSQAAIVQCKAYNDDYSGIDDVLLPETASESARLWLASAHQDHARALKKENKNYQQSVDAAYAEVAKVLKVNKQSAKAIAIAAWVMSERGNYEMAAKLYATAAIYVPYDTSLIFNEAQMLAELGREDEARVLLSRLMAYHRGGQLSEEGRALYAKLYPEGGDEAMSE